MQIIVMNLLYIALLFTALAVKYKRDFMGFWVQWRGDFT